jgi:exodeoxyribonuclease III
MEGLRIMKVVTWNINSVRHRIALVARFLREKQPDVLCLQETKVANELFPGEALARLGYVHQAIHGQKAYHGVAVLSRLPFKKTGTQDFCREGHARHIGVTLANGVELHNFYVPAGGDIPDPDVNDKFAHKLAFLDEMAEWLEEERDSRRPMILVGDLNVAPLEHDVWSHKQLLKIVSHTPVEVEKLGRVQRSAKWVDAVRYFVPQDQKLYSWWSYRARDWQASDRGRRLDHIWVTPPLEKSLKRHDIARAARGWPVASDHVPVSVTLAI